MNSSEVAKWWLLIGAISTLVLYERVGFSNIKRSFVKDKQQAFVTLLYFVTAWPYWILDFMFGTWWRKK